MLTVHATQIDKRSADASRPTSNNDDASSRFFDDKVKAVLASTERHQLPTRASSPANETPKELIKAVHCPSFPRAVAYAVLRLNLGVSTEGSGRCSAAVSDLS